MLHHSVTIAVPCTPEAAFTFIATDFFENHRRWDPAITELTQTSPAPLGVGTTGREVRQFGGRQVADFRVTEYAPARRFAFTNTSGAFWLDRAYTLTPDDGGTRICFTFDMRPRALPMRLFAPLLHGMIKAQVTANIERLRHLLTDEAGRSRRPVAPVEQDRPLPVPQL
jgi:hypothetical protein